MNVVIYARFSSHSQTEQSIEGQLKVCYEYARAHGHVIVGEYIDRAQSGTNDNRQEFQKMIQDSERHTFQGVLVYQLDRFAKNRYDSAINKAKLKKNGVRVLSAKENITEDASGILIEGVLESMAEYYSVELAQKINRGMEINAQKCLSTGSNPGLGYIVNKDRSFSVDPSAAAIVIEIFERYAAHETAADIIRDLNARKLTTSLGKPFNKNSLHRLLRNKRYIGIYMYKGNETPGGMPRIVSDELFYRVQKILGDNKAAPARARGKEEYFLTTKLFCGHCNEMMTGFGGTSKHGVRYHYYKCNGAKKKTCSKKPISKELIEEAVVNVCMDLLTEERIKIIADKILDACKRDGDLLSIKRLQMAIKETDAAIENLWVALEKGQSVEIITERINKRENEKKGLLKQLAIEKRKKIGYDYSQVMAFLNYLRDLPGDNEMKKRSLINIFVNAVYLYDDHFNLILNSGHLSVSVGNIPFSTIEKVLNSSVSSKFIGVLKTFPCSPFGTPAPPAASRRGQFVTNTDSDFQLYAQSPGLSVVTLAPPIIKATLLGGFYYWLDSKGIKQAKKSRASDK